MTDIALIEKRIRDMKARIANDIQSLMRLEQLKHSYYKNMMGRKERYDVE